MSNINEYDLLTLYNETFISYHEKCQHLEDLQNAVMLKIHAQVKDPFKGQGRPMDFNGTEDRKFNAMVSDSMLQLTFKKVLV